MSSSPGSLVYLEVLQSGVYADVSVNQWLGLTSKKIVKDYLGVGDGLEDLGKVACWFVEEMGIGGDEVCAGKAWGCVDGIYGIVW